MITYENIIEYFKACGAVYYKTHIVKFNHPVNGTVDYPFCLHFFDENDKEIGYYHKDISMYYKFPDNERRVWHESFFNNKYYSDKIYL